jgi:ABC-type sugar transport system permease subunit
MAPALLLVAAVSFLPLGQAIMQSLHRSNYLELGDFVGVLNYQRFVLSEAGLARAWNSLVFVLGSLVVAMPLGFGLALLLNLPLRARWLLRTV